MSDEVDRAQAANEAFQSDALAAHRRKALTGAASAHICIDCDEPIPEARRAAAPGCTRCVECQSLHENWRAL